jgi:nitrogen regulatory protein PII
MLHLQTPTMKLIQCIIRQEKLDEIVDKLAAVSSGLTVSDVRGHGRQKGRPMVYRGTEYHMVLLPKVMIEILAEDNKVDDLLKVVVETARTGEIGDGRIFVLEVEETYHIRSGFMNL